MNKLLINNSGKYRLIRTIIQGIIGVLIANIDMIVGTFEFSPEMKALIVALVMAILSPVMSSLGTTDMKKDPIPDGYFENMKEEGNDDSK